MRGRNHKILVNPQLCRDCQTCVLACSLYHENVCSLSLARLQIIKDMEIYEFNILICRHCDQPECVLACPCNAIQVNKQGVILIMAEDCNQCGLCALNCPYEAIFYCEVSGKYNKCDLCANRLGGPLCVELCPVKAITLNIETASARRD